MRRIIYDSAEIFEFFLHQKARRGLFHELGYPHSGSMRSMRGAEGVVAVDVAQRRKLARERLVILLFFWIKAEVLQQQHLAIFQGRNFCGWAFADTIVGEI